MTTKSTVRVTVIVKGKKVVTKMVMQTAAPQVFLLRCPHVFLLRSPLSKSSRGVRHLDKSKVRKSEDKVNILDGMAI
jgi:hypothetical protein